MKARKTKRAHVVRQAKPSRFKTPDDYLATVPEEKRAALEELRKTIREAVPGAEECISYNLPAFRLKGRFFVGYGAAVRHCSFYAGSVVQKLSDDLKRYEISEGTVRFSAANPLPPSLVRKLVKQRLKDKDGET